MKILTQNLSILRLLIFSTFLLPWAGNAQNSVVIGGTTPNPNAVLMLIGNGTQGLIIPVTTDQNSIAKVIGMIVYNSTDKTIYSCDGTTWKSLSGAQAYTAGTGISLTGSTIANTGDTDAADDITTATSGTGDVTGNFPALTVAKIRGVNVAATAPISNQVLQFNGTTWTPSTLAVGSGTVTNVSATAPLIVSTPTTTPALSMSQANTTTNGFLSSADWNSFNSKLGITSTPAAGDISGSFNTGLQITANTIVNADVSATAAIAGTKITPDFGNQKLITTGSTVFNTVTNTWPGTQGAANTFLRNDGVGNLSWVATPSPFSNLNVIPKGDGTGLVASSIFDNGSNIGIGTITPSTLAKMHIVGGSFLIEGNTGNTPLSGGGRRLMWIPAKEAIRAGSVSSTEWDDVNIGIGSAVFGQNNTASAQASTAIGQANVASGVRSFAGGVSSLASGNGSTALGEGVTASTRGGFAVGHYNIGSGTASSFASADPVFEVGIGTSTAAKANAFTVLHGGNVGIGTDAPDVLFHTFGGNGVGTKVEASGSSLVQAIVGIKASGTGLSPVTQDYEIAGYAGGLFIIGTQIPNLVFRMNGTNLFNMTSSSFDPWGTGSKDLGSSNFRWNSLYYTTGILGTSDQRLKTNIIPMEYGLQDILKLRPVSFTWKKKPEEGKQFGLIAQDVQKVLPEIVNIASDADKTLSLNHLQIIPVLIKAMQEQQQTIEGLEAKIRTLQNKEGDIADMKAELSEIKKMLSIEANANIKKD